MITMKLFYPIIILCVVLFSGCISQDISATNSTNNTTVATSKEEIVIVNDQQIKTNIESPTEDPNEDVSNSVGNYATPYESVHHIVYPCDENGIYVCSAQWKFVRLVNNLSAVTPTYAQVEQFIYADKTDTIPASDEYMICADYAERVHNNAEYTGIRCGLITLNLSGKEYHTANAFNTSDKGLVAIDCTGTHGDPFDTHDTIAKISVGYPYDRKGMISQRWGEYDKYPAVSSYHIYW